MTTETIVSIFGVTFVLCNDIFPHDATQVIAQFKRKWDGSVLLRKRANSCTATTVSVCNIDEKYRVHAIESI